jgi:hypothetical protein
MGICIGCVRARPRSGVRRSAHDADQLAVPVTVPAPRAPSGCPQALQVSPASIVTDHDLAVGPQYTVATHDGLTGTSTLGASPSRGYRRWTLVAPRQATVLASPVDSELVRASSPGVGASDSVRP